MSNDSLAIFRATVAHPHRKVSWTIRMLKSVRYVARYPASASEIGLISAGLNAIFANDAICSTFFMFADPNSSNRNLNQHGFTIDHSCDVAAEFLRAGIVLNPHGWYKRICASGGFNLAMTGEDAERVTNYARLVRLHVIQTRPAAQATTTESPELPESADAEDSDEYRMFTYDDDTLGQGWPDPI